MKNLSLEVTHSLSFLSNILTTINKLETSTSSIIDKIYSMDIDKKDGPDKMREETNDYRDEIDEEIEFMMADYKLFQEEISDVVKHKDHETVIYSLRQYRSLYKKFEDKEKKLKSLNTKYDNKSKSCVKEKDYIRFLSLNKISIPIYRMKKIVESCLYALEHLVEDKKKEDQD